MYTFNIIMWVTLFGTGLLSVNDERVHIMLNGDLIPATQLEKGAIDYYISSTYEQKVVQAGPGHFSVHENMRVDRYFLGIGNHVEEVTPYNYKLLIKKFLPKAHELHQRLGKKGFRFENVQYMVRFYNKFKE